MIYLYRLREHKLRGGEVMESTSNVAWNKGAVSEGHDTRKKELCKREKHIDLDNIMGDSYHEVWLRRDLKEVYDETFNPSINEHNSKQKRNDRKLTVEKYMQKIQDDKRGKKQTHIRNGKRVVKDKQDRTGQQLEYEIVPKVGNSMTVAKDENGRFLYDKTGHQIRTEYLPREVQYNTHKRYCETFQERNPNFILTNIDYHADEFYINSKGVKERSVDHPHIRFVPIGHGYKKGLSVQNSLSRALEEMGHSLESWNAKENALLEQILIEEYNKYCEDHPEFYSKNGELEIYHPVRDKQREGGKTKEQVQEDKRLEELKGELNARQKALEDDKKAVERGQQAIDRTKMGLGIKQMTLNNKQATLNKKQKELKEQKENLETKYKQKETELNNREDTLNKRVNASNLDFLKKEAELDEMRKKIENEANKRTEELNERENKLNERENRMKSDFDTREKGLNGRESDLNKKEAELDLKSEEIENKAKKVDRECDSKIEQAKAHIQDMTIQQASAMMKDHQKAIEFNIDAINALDELKGMNKGLEF